MDAATINSPLGEIDQALHDVLNGEFNYVVPVSSPDKPNDGLIIYLSDNALWQKDSSGVEIALFSQVAYVLMQDQKASGTNAGTFTIGAWRTRDLNTIIVDTSGIVLLVANQITLPAGSYIVHAIAPAYRVNLHQARLYDITHATELLLGVVTRAEATIGHEHVSVVDGLVTLTETAVLELQHRCSATFAAGGFGLANSLAVEIYSQIEFIKVA